MLNRSGRRVGAAASFLALLAGCGGESTPHAVPSAPAVREQLSDERKAAVRQFWTHYRRATDLRVNGHTAQALEAYEQALSFDPRHEDALYYLGNVSLESGQFEKAQRSWRQLVEINSHSARAHGQLGALYAAGIPGAPFDLDVAETEIMRAHTLNREESGPLEKLGEIAVLKGNHSLARQRLGEAQQINHRSPGARYLIGYLDWLASDMASAREHLQAAIELSSGASYSESASSEGNTSKGSRPLLEGGLRYTAALPAQWARLRDWSGPVTQASVSAEYERLQALIARTLRGQATPQPPPH